MSDMIFRCCDRNPEFLVTYSVAGIEKQYAVCTICQNLEYFQKFILKKTKLNKEVIYVD